ncbi:aminoglycoside 3'-phosphotransferase [Roseateles sp. DAIF2]|nr:aminoglycoside 3'-phosphotransferase [Roseateles sp. DAIF2]
MQQLPPEVRRFIGDAALRRDPVGESPCRVYRFDKGGAGFFLKLCPKPYANTTYGALREARLIDWLGGGGRLLVPELVLAVGAAEGECLITREVPGRPLSALLASRPEAAVEIFVEALRQLQAVPARDCPFDAGIAMRLAELRRLLAQGLCADDADMAQWPEIQAATPAALLAHLELRRPEREDLVFSHGDLSDGNVFVDEARERLHFIDLGRGGLADRWLDIAFAQRNLREELGEAPAQRLLDGLGRPDQPQRRRYFEQLDELF